MENLLDTHYHLDFIQDKDLSLALVKEVQDKKISLVSQGLLPSDFLTGLDLVKEAKKENISPPLLSLGFHPWWIESESQAQKELVVFEKYLDYSRFIGEIGLDYSPKILEKIGSDLQDRVFSKIIEILVRKEKSGPHILSIHAVRSSTRVLDILQGHRALDHNIIPVFHYFSGSSDELTRLIRMGAYISVSETMLKSKKSKAYVKQVPGSRILLETDLPKNQIQARDSEDMDRIKKDLLDGLTNSIYTSLDQISQIRNEDMREIIIENQNRLYY